MGQQPHQSGHPIHGAAVGILMLNTRFQRLPGDIGHAGSWDFPVLYKVIKSATQERVFAGDFDGLLSPFIAGCEELAALGALGIVTSCGFLAPMQQQLAERSPVPVISSALMQVPLARSLLAPGRSIGVITIDAAALTDHHFPGAFKASDFHIVGMPAGGVLRSDLRGNAAKVDPQAQADELCAVGRALVSDRPDTGALVIECTNLAPHSSALQQATGLPVFDIVTLVNWFHSALQARVWPGAWVTSKT